MTATLGFEPSSMYYRRSHSSESNPTTRSSSSIHNTGLPSPPASTRTSIETPPKPVSSPASRIDHTSSAIPTPIPVGSFPSPPESQAGSPPKTSSVRHVLLQLQPFLESGEHECEVDGITPALLAELKVHMIQNGQAGVWESLRVDFRPDKLIVRLPTLGHEIMSDLFHVMARSGTGYPERYGSSTIIEGGSADIHYRSGGYKTPDFSLYEVKDGEGVVNDDDNTTPTVAFEVAYTQTSRNLVEEAARHICLTMGRVLLVVAIDIIHERNTHPRKLHSVTWSHWEEDVRAYGVVTKQDEEEVNEVHAERRYGEDDTLYVLPPATAFSALMSVPGDDTKYRIRVNQTAKWELFSDPKISRIDILHRHLYRDPDDADWDTPAFSFSVSDIMAVIFKHEALQEQSDRKSKRGLAADLETLSVLEARRAKRQNRAGPSSQQAV